ncbi:MAG: 1-acyl-sn-glycerol-3-phosphate acyltransferase [Actinobacteria bacterium]|nr:1-acyl-sn-glycerol-3-phosphate acyltransferase [Actinomycetota bacterium]
MKLYSLLERTGYRKLAARLYHVELSGVEHVPGSGGVILVANHESMFDPWILALATPRTVRFMAKSELWKYRIVARMMESFGAFPVERGSGDATAMSRAAQLLNDGQVLGLFPQGTSKPGAGPRRYHRGAARLALATGAPLVPVGMIGTRGVPWPWRHPKVRVTVGEPIIVPVGRPTMTAARALTEELEQRVAHAIA